MKIDRLIGIITVLLRQDKTTAPELARRFEVSRRTINRDIESICKAGIPLVTTQGYGGGISIADGYKIDKSLFTQEELQMLFTGLKGIDSISETSYLTGFLEKLSNKNSRIIAGDFMMIDLASHYQRSLIQKIEIIKKAIPGKRVLSFRYYYRKGEGNRIVEPYRLVFQWSSWYLFGYCLEKKDYRLFKLNRLWNLRETGQTFSEREIPPEELNFETYFSSETIRLQAVFYKSEKYRLIEEYGVDSFSVMEDGNLFFEQNFASYENMRQWIFSFGDKVRVVGPEKLKNDREKQAENILKDIGQASFLPPDH